MTKSSQTPENGSAEQRSARLPRSEGTVVGAWTTVVLVVLMFVLFFGATLAVNAAMHAWVRLPFLN